METCQICSSRDLDPVIFLGYLPPVNEMKPIGSRPVEEAAYPAQVLRCRACGLIQLGLVVDPRILFPPSYPYRSGTTRILREDFADLAREVSSMVSLAHSDLVVDIGSNDGTLLAEFAGTTRVLGIEPTDMGKLANDRGIPTVAAFFNTAAAHDVVGRHGTARVVTAANVLAHIADIHGTVDGILEMLAPDGVFVSESHYWPSLVETLQYDAIYHEHLRYYSVGTIRYLLALHDLEVFHVRRIPTHGGSIRVYAGRRGRYAVRDSVAAALAEEQTELTDASLARFRRRVVMSKLALQALLHEVRSRGARVYGVGAPSRASTLIHYVGIDDGVVERVLEVRGSHKIGRYMPGTLIPVVDEGEVVEGRPERLLIFSWHIAEDVVDKMRAQGYAGKFIVPLPDPREE